jgi:hypothetical protein
MAIRWMKWVKTLGDTAGHRLFLLPAADMDAREVVEAAESAFPGAVTVLRDAENIKSDWQSTDLARSAAGPNSAFRQLAWHFFLNKLGPWLFCEMDCIPLKPGWLNAIETEYQRAGKPFMGAHVLIPKVPPHLTGNAVYSEDAVSLAPTLVMRTNWTTPEGTTFELAFDVASATEVLPQSHFTNLIQHEFRHQGFKNRAEVDALVRSDAVMFHSNKDGSLIQLLKSNVLRSAEMDSEMLSSGNEIITTIDAPEPVRESAANGQTKPDSRASLLRDTVAILRQLGDTPSRRQLVHRELRRQKIMR